MMGGEFREGLQPYPWWEVGQIDHRERGTKQLSFRGEKRAPTRSLKGRMGHCKGGGELPRCESWRGKGLG